MIYVFATPNVGFAALEEASRKDMITLPTEWSGYSKSMVAKLIAERKDSGDKILLCPTFANFEEMIADLRVQGHIVYYFYYEGDHGSAFVKESKSEKLIQHRKEDLDFHAYKLKWEGEDREYIKAGIKRLRLGRVFGV